MTYFSLRRPLIAALLALALPWPAAAQLASADEAPMAYDDLSLARRAAERDDPAEALARYLRVLARNPAELEALTGAGKASLDLGDSNAALAFYGRAEQIAPRNGRIKAGIASAMVQMEQPKSALRMFAEAVELGVPPLDIAVDRGLAYDLRGDQRRAQFDYNMVLRQRNDPEATRRLALSLAIAGDPDGALALLDPLLRQQDKAAWRARVFVMALTGKVSQAQDVARQVLPNIQAEALAPYLVRIGGLKPAQKAAAVHFGHFPSDGKSYSQNEIYAAAAAADPPKPPPRPAPFEVWSLAPTPATKAPVAERPARRPAVPVAPPERASLASVKAAIEKAAAAEVKPVPATKLAAETKPLPEAKPAPATKPEPPAKLVETKPGATKRDADCKPARNGRHARKAISAACEPEAALTAKEQKAKDAADKKLGDKKLADKKEAEKKAKADAATAKASKGKEPSRIWVQVATGAYKPDLGKEWGKLKAKHPALLGKRAPWTTPLNRTNRLLIGPFASPAEAQAFVNNANKTGFSTSTFTSSAGQAVERVN
jgi:Flp pilus assembly protein TadD